MLEFAAVAKAQITQSLLTAMLEQAGYHVHRFGIEERLLEIKYLDAARYAQLALAPRLRTLPDLLISASDLSVAYLIEVKFRARLRPGDMRALQTTLRQQFDHWPGLFVVLFLGESFWDGRGYVQDHVRVLRASDLDAFADERVEMARRWEALPMLHHAVAGLTFENYHGHADRITDLVRILAAI